MAIREKIVVALRNGTSKLTIKPEELDEYPIEYFDLTEQKAKKEEIIQRIQNLKKLEAQKNKANQLAAEELQQAKDLKEKLEKITVELEAKAGEGGRLFGSVTTKQIAEALQAKSNIKIDKRKMDLPDGIRALGYTKVPVKLHHEVTATLNVHVKEVK